MQLWADSTDFLFAYESVHVLQGVLLHNRL